MHNSHDGFLCGHWRCEPRSSSFLDRHFTDRAEPSPYPNSSIFTEEVVLQFKSLAALAEDPSSISGVHVGQLQGVTRPLLASMGDRPHIGAADPLWSSISVSLG